MTIKKMMLLASMALAAIAFAAPAAAQAEIHWYVEGSSTPIEESTKFTAEGVITSEASGGAFNTTGGVTFNGELEPGGGGTIEGGAILGEPTTNLPGCKATSGTILNLPWAITTSTPDNVTIKDATFMNHYSAGCAMFGVPSTVSVTGDVTGTLVHKTEKTCIVLNKSGHMKNETTGGAVTLTGEVCIPKITFKATP